MNHLHRRVIGAALVAATLIGGAYALLGTGFAVIVGVGVFGLYAIVLAGLIVFEEEARLPFREEGRAGNDHGYHPAR